MVLDRPLIVFVRSRSPPPQKVVPGMHVQRKFKQVQSTVVPVVVVLLVCVHEFALQKNCSTRVALPVLDEYHN